MSHGIVVGVERWLEKSVHAKTAMPRMKSCTEGRGVSVVAGGAVRQGRDTHADELVQEHLRQARSGVHVQAEDPPRPVRREHERIVFAYGDERVHGLLRADMGTLEGAGGMEGEEMGRAWMSVLYWT